MDTKAFSFNSNGGGSPYPKGAQFTEQDDASFCDTLAKLYICVLSTPEATHTGFRTQFPDVFEKYRLPDVSSDKLVQAWNSSQMQFWQNQVNFAVWCATTGCGVSAQDHLAAKDPMMQSLYLFHVYYQTRRILAEIKAALPQDQAWVITNNPYDRRAYERICNEFEISPHTDWRVKGPNNGLGRVYFYISNKGYSPIYGVGDSLHYDLTKMSFKRPPPIGLVHVDYIRQDQPNAEYAWTTFILNKSEGFTRPGVERLNDSIRTYVWAILGSQADTRTGILGSGTAFDAQKQFLVNIEDTISSPVDLPSAIRRYQDILRYAGSEVNFVFGFGLYMAPSDMLLRVGRVMGYNNKIVIASAKQKLGVNVGVNASNGMPPDVEASDANNTGEKGLVEPQQRSVAAGGTPPPISAHPKPPTQALASVESQRHEEAKTALIVGGVAAGLLMLWFISLLRSDSP